MAHEYYMRHSNVRRLASTVLVAITTLLTACGARTITSSSSELMPNMPSFVALRACASLEQTMADWTESIKYFPSVEDVTDGSAFRILNNDYKHTLEAESRLRSMAADSPYVHEAVTLFEDTLTHTREALRGMRTSVGSRAHAESAMAEMAQAIDELSRDGRVLFTLCSPANLARARKDAMR